MLRYIVQRFLVMIPLLLAVSLLAFIVIEMPPGDYVTSYIQELEATGTQVEQEQIAQLKEQYGLNRPAIVRYALWMKRILLHGDFGRSLEHQKSVNDILRDRLPMTVTLSLLSTLFVFVVAIPIGIYSAIRQYSLFDYIWTFIGFIGLAVPPFLFALLLMFVVFSKTGITVTSLFSREFVDAPWSWAKLIDMFKHIWLPLIVIGAASTAGLIRVLRGTLLDELKKEYVTTARAKGLPEWKLLLKYPIRVAMNPVVSTIGWILPRLVGGAMIVSMVLNLRTVGSVFLSAIQSQDMYLAGSIVLIISMLTIIGTFISDMLLACLDPRIRFGEKD
jgi:peptide/nickel transport system permease protein